MINFIKMTDCWILLKIICSGDFICIEFLTGIT